MPFEPDPIPQSRGRFVPDDEQKHIHKNGAFDDLLPPSSGGAFDDLIPPSNGGAFDDLLPQKQEKRVKQDRSWAQAAGDTAIDAAKGVVGLGESVVGVTDLVTGNLAGKGWSELGFDPARTKQILSDLYSDPRQQANRNVASAKGFVDTTKALLENPSAAVGFMVESAPMMLGGAAVVRGAATRMLAARGLVAGSAEASAFFVKSCCGGAPDCHRQRGRRRHDGRQHSGARTSGWAGLHRHCTCSRGRWRTDWRNWVRYVQDTRFP